MIQLQQIQKNAEDIINRLLIKKYIHARQEIEAILALDIERRSVIQSLEEGRGELNRISKQVGIEMGKGNNAAAEEAKLKTQDLKAQIINQEQYLATIEQKLKQALSAIPNPAHSSVPMGNSAEDNPVIISNNLSLNLPLNPKPHWEIATNLGLIDWEAGVKITGSGFPVYKNQGAKLQRALINFFLDSAVKQGYQEIQPPILVNSDSAFGTGQLPDKDGQMYFVTDDNFYLIPTAEVPVTNVYRNEIIEEDNLPVKLCGYTPCFRREAGSYGKDVRGLNRLHQFDKVEIVQIVQAEKSYETLEEMAAYVRGLLEALELPYRMILLCGGDMGFASAKTYDLEVYSGGQQRWLEVSSVSNFESYQANRMLLRTRLKDQKKPELAHTLNGSALALPRIVASILENFQQADGSVKLPSVLVPYFGATHITPSPS